MAGGNGRVPEDFSDMLESENFADATVTCGDRTWKIHKFIVCRRSVWFSKALSGNFKEGSSGLIQLEELDSVHVGWVIQYLYAANTDFLRPLLDDDKTVHATCTDLYRIGDYFQLDYLMESSCNSLRRHNRRAAAVFQRMYNKNNEHDLDSEYLERFFSQAKIAFSAKHPALQDAFYHFFQCTRFIILVDEEVHNHLREIPELSNYLLREMWTGHGEGVVLTNFISDCSACGKSISSRKSGFIRSTEMYLRKGKGGKYSVAHASTCDKCYESDSGSADEDDETSSEGSSSSSSSGSDD